jgi:hypothetical protein
VTGAAIAVEAKRAVKKEAVKRIVKSFGYWV